MSSMYEDVAKFHLEVLGMSAPWNPTMLSQRFAIERLRFLNEEIEEYGTAAIAGDMVGAVDGLLDTVYVALGTLYMMGVPVQECWDAVQRANMRKVKGVTSRGNEIDAAKPDDWTGPEPEIADAIRKAIDR